MFLVFNTGRENSDEERVVIKLFVDMYYNFAASSSAIYGNVNVARIEPNDFKALEINSASDYGIKQLDDEFGQVQFWNYIEEMLVSAAGSRKQNYVIVTALVSLVMVWCAN